VSKPIVTLNLGKLFTGSSTRNTDDLIEALRQDGYHVATIDHVQAPAIDIEWPAPSDRRERIATATLMGFCARQSPDWVDQNLSRIAATADAFIKELDK